MSAVRQAPVGRMRARHARPRTVVVFRMALRVLLADPAFAALLRQALRAGRSDERIERGVQPLCGGLGVGVRVHLAASRPHRFSRSSRGDSSCAAW